MGLSIFGIEELANFGLPPEGRGREAIANFGSAIAVILCGWMTVWAWQYLAFTIKRGWKTSVASCSLRRCLCR
jgi:hypothetical protein